VFGVWCLVFGVWCLVFGVWCLVFGEKRNKFDLITPLKLFCGALMVDRSTQS
jgi:hypothetical protein